MNRVDSIRLLHGVILRVYDEDPDREDALRDASPPAPCYIALADFAFRMASWIVLSIEGW